MPKAPYTGGTGDNNDYNEKMRQALLTRLMPSNPGQSAGAADDVPPAQGLLQPAPDPARAAYLQSHPNYLNQVNAFNNGQSQISGQPDAMSQALKKRKVSPQNYPAIDPSEVPSDTNN